MAKLMVKRKGYVRKAYIRKDGTRVKAAKVGGSTFSVKDRGKRGRTPESQQWYKPTAEMGWSKLQGVETRRRLALRAHKGSKLSAGRALQALSNVTTDAETKSKAKADAQYFFAQHRESK